MSVLADMARMARCSGLCGRELPSSPALPHFEPRGEGSPAALYVCWCGRLEVLHEQIGHAFEPRGAQPHDVFYDGCW